MMMFVGGGTTLPTSARVGSHPPLIAPISDVHVTASSPVIAMRGSRAERHFPIPPSGVGNVAEGHDGEVWASLLCRCARQKPSLASWMQAIVGTVRRCSVRSRKALMQWSPERAMRDRFQGSAASPAVSDTFL